MIHINQEFWEVVSEDDIGRITGVVSRWATEELAKEAKPSSCWYSIRKTKLDFKIFQTVEEYQLDKKSQLIKSALAKLSKEEIEALGVSDV